VAYAGGVQPQRGSLTITTSNESRQLLAMVEAEVGSLLELLPVAVLVTSEAGIVLRANPAAGVALGVAEEALVGRRVDELLLGTRFPVRVRTLCHDAQVLRLYVL
jgi:PAS domain-containing protein